MGRASQATSCVLQQMLWPHLTIGYKYQGIEVDYPHHCNLRNLIPQIVRSTISMSWPPTAACSEDKKLAHRSLSCYTALMSHHLLIHCHYPKNNTWKQETKEASLNLRNVFTLMYDTAKPHKQLKVRVNHFVQAKSWEEMPVNLHFQDATN